MNPVKTLEVNQDLDNYEEKWNKVNKSIYQDTIGSLMYLSTGTKPNISFNMNKLLQYNNDPRQINFIALKMI